MLPHIREGRLRGLAICADQRWPTAADIPTTDEAGPPGFRAGSWAWAARARAHAARRAGAYPARDRRGAAPAQDAAALPGIQCAASQQHTAQAFDAFIRAEAERYGRVIRETGIRID